MRKTYRRSRADYPRGVLGIYDNGAETADRYTVVYEPYEVDHALWFPYVGMSASPYHPQGVCLHGESRQRFSGEWGSHSGAGKTINFAELPPDCQLVVLDDVADYAAELAGTSA